MFTDYVNQVISNRTNLNSIIHFKNKTCGQINKIQTYRDNGYNVALLALEEYWQCFKKEKTGYTVVVIFLLTLIKIQKQVN